MGVTRDAADVSASGAPAPRWPASRRIVTALFVGLLIAIVGFAGHPTPLAQGLAALTIMVVLAHSFLALGVVEASAFASICLLVTFGIETVGMQTGFPFGAYTFNVGASLPHVGPVPIIVGPLYFGMGYPAWVIANFLLNDRVGRPAGALQLFALPVTAAFVLVQWDVVMDPVNSTQAHAWTWFSGGGYFGVPLSNYAGWFIETYLFFQLFAAFQYMRRKRPAVRTRFRAFWAVPVTLYLAAGLCHIISLADGDDILHDARGRTWSAADLHVTTTIVAMFTMAPSALLALFRLVRSPALDGPERGPISRWRPATEAETKRA